MCCYTTDWLTAGVPPQDPNTITISNPNTNPTLTLTLTLSQSLTFTLTQVGEGEYVLLYDRLANGWSDPPGPYPNINTNPNPKTGG